MKSDELGIPDGPPWEVDVVADVHAGVYPPEQTTALLRRMADDPDAAAILAALDSTVDDLSLLPDITMPRQYVQRLDAVIAAEYAAIDSARPAPATRSDVVRGQFGALLAKGAPAAPPGLGRGPLAPGQAGPALPRQSGPAQPLPRRQPMIPRVLPRAPQAPTPPGRPAQHPAAGTAPAAATPTNVRSLPPARPDRPADGRPPTGAGATGPHTAKPNGPTRVGSLEAQRIKRRRWTGGLLAAAAVAAVAIGATVALNNNSSDSGIAGDGSPAPSVTAPGAGDNGEGGLEAFVLEPGKFGDKLSEIEGAEVTNGSLSDSRTFTSCLTANDIDLTKYSGVTEVTFKDQKAYAIAVNLDANTVEVVVVGTNCGVDGDPATLDRETVTR